jgi:hypothetical protein
MRFLKPKAPFAAFSPQYVFKIRQRKLDDLEGYKALYVEPPRQQPESYTKKRLINAIFQ